jgi:hypothetical protein
VSWFAAGVVVAVTAALVVAVAADRVPVRRLPWLRLALAPIGVAAVVVPGTAGLVAFVLVLAGIATISALTFRRHGPAAWVGRTRSPGR